MQSISIWEGSLFQFWNSSLITKHTPWDLLFESWSQTMPSLVPGWQKLTELNIRMLPDKARTVGRRRTPQSWRRRGQRVWGWYHRPAERWRRRMGECRSLGCPGRCRTRPSGDTISTLISARLTQFFLRSLRCTSSRSSIDNGVSVKHVRIKCSTV